MSERRMEGWEKCAEREGNECRRVRLTIGQCT